MYYRNTLKVNNLSKTTLLDLLLPSRYHKAGRIWYGLLISLSTYILFPTITNTFRRISGKRTIKESNKRVDKTTTGLINNRNDCFANSSIQALAGLDFLVKYLNTYLKNAHDGRLSELIKDENHRSIATNYDCCIHNAIIKVINELQEVILLNTNTDIRPIIVALEKTFQSKLTSSQNDAHEFSQILLQSLKTEFDRHLVLFDNARFPFEGRIANQLICLSCQHSSELICERFLIYELPTPQKYSTTINDIILKENTEIIEGYSCLRCKINAILENEKRVNPKGVHLHKSEKEFLEFLQSNTSSLAINSDIPGNVSDYIELYNKNGCRPSHLKTKIIRKNVIIDAPDIFTIHLSRSMFNGVNTTRNPCRVQFDENLEIQQQIIIENRCTGIIGVKYKLKSIIKHTGTHYQGHYQCFRHKPDFVKIMESGDIVNRTPKINIYSNEASVNSNEEEKKIEDIQNDGKIKKKVKKFKSVSHYPYWHISDTKVSEVSTNGALSESKYVYMLYYEKIKSRTL